MSVTIPMRRTSAVPHVSLELSLKMEHIQRRGARTPSIPGGAEWTVCSDKPNRFAPFRITTDFPAPSAPTTAMVTGSTLSSSDCDYSRAQRMRVKNMKIRALEYL